MIKQNANAQMNALLNNFAIRCFRDTADKDYISARLSFKSGLYPPFQWSALHCLEKYAKCIMLINRVDGRKIKHEILASIDLINGNSKLRIALSSDSKKCISDLEKFARFRYLEVSRGCQGTDIMRLDKAVFELRRYCKVIDFDIKIGESKVNLLAPNLEAIEKSNSATKNGYRLIGGYLEKVIEKKTHPARAGLIWKNLWFSNSMRQSVKIRDFHEFEYSPLDLHSDLVETVMNYVILPKEIKDRHLKLNE